MGNAPKPFLLLENRPILCSALLDRIRGGGGGEFAQFNDYADLAKNMHPDSICFLAVHLLPVDVPTVLRIFRTDFLPSRMASQC